MTDRVDRRRVLKAVGTAGLLGGVTGLAGCSGGSSAQTTTTEATTTTESSADGGEWQETDTVDMTAELKFVPKRIQVAKGTTVTWENTGEIGHTVTAYEDEIPDGATYFASGGFDSEQAARDGYPEGNVTGGKSYEHTFEVTGTFKYFCIPHEMNGMVGFVKVI